MNYQETDADFDCWMVQGNRKVNPGSTESNAAIKLGELAAKHNVKLKLGAYGDYVDLLGRSGANVVCHTCHGKERDTKIPENVEVVDCFSMAAQLAPNDPNDITAWYLRLDKMTRGIDAAIYFSGGPGTKLHMTPIGFNLANLSRNKPLHVPKIALIGWHGQDLEYLVGYWRIKEFYNSFSEHVWRVYIRPNYWIASFSLGDVDKMVDWLLS